MTQISESYKGKRVKVVFRDGHTIIVYRGLFLEEVDAHIMILEDKIHKNMFLNKNDIIKIEEDSSVCEKYGNQKY